MKDALTLGQELKVLEKEQSQNRIDRALSVGNPNQHHIDMPPINKDERWKIACLLYQATEATGKPEPQTPEETLDMFCWLIFGCEYREVLKAWEKYLG